MTSLFANEQFFILKTRKHHVAILKDGHMMLSRINDFIKLQNVYHQSLSKIHISFALIG